MIIKMAPKMIQKPVFRDSRGYFIEQYHSNKIDEYTVIGFNNGIQQVSESHSNSNTFRGFHLQLAPKMNKIMRVTKGSAHILCINLTEKEHQISYHYLSEMKSDSEYVFYLYVPFNYAVGFVTYEPTNLQYFHSSCRDNPMSRTINFQSILDLYHTTISYNVFSDNHSLDKMEISEKDRKAPSLQEWLKTEEWKLLV